MALSRCIGYTSATGLGVTATPETTIHELAEGDRFVILATDGIWAVLTSEEAVRIVARVCAHVLWGGTGAGASDDARPPASPAEERGRTVTTAGSRSGRSRGQLRSRSGGSALGSGSDGEGGGGGGGAAVTLSPGGRPSRRSLATSPRGTTAASGGGGFRRPRRISAAASVASGEGDDDDDLVAGAKALDPRTTDAARVVMPTVGGAAYVDHSAALPGAESRALVCAGAAPASGCGGGSEIALDLVESLMPPEVRAVRVERRRRTALAAAEELVAVARSRWHGLTAAAATRLALQHGSLGIGSAPVVGSASGAAWRSPHDDMSALVLLLEH